MTSATQFQRQEGDVIGSPESHVHDHGWEWGQQHLSHMDSKGEVGRLPRGKNDRALLLEKEASSESVKSSHMWKMPTTQCLGCARHIPCVVIM